MSALEFDYIIVGAGSAGCVLANRLTESGKNSVLLLESGGSDARFWVKVPLGYAINVTNPAVNWPYHTAPDPKLNSRSIRWPRGKIIGGSSSLNAMAYVRGLPSDFDDWANAGAEGWNWNTVRSVYERMETKAEVAPQGPRKSGSGPVVVSDLSDQMSPFSKHFLSAARDAGYPVIPDMNVQGSDGVSYYRSNVRNGFRWSSADAFLRPAQKRSNLRVLCHADVDRLIVDQSAVSGVKFRHKGQNKHATARKEVILCAGAINSPKLLQLSGIGPADLLRRFGIPVVRDLPEVGRGLQDHLAISYQFRTNTPTLNNTLGRMFGKLSAGVRYVLTRKGPLAVPINQVGGFVRSDPHNAGLDTQLYMNPVSFKISKSGKVVVDRLGGYQISAQQCRPTSRGMIEITSPNAQDTPMIAPRSLSTETDQIAAINAGRILQRLAATQSLQAVTEKALAPDLMAMDDTALLEDFRNRASTVYHPTCTCRMGTSKKTSVLDAQLRVHGMSGVRVVDASAFPTITSGNTNAPTMMLAMRAADLILENA